MRLALSLALLTLTVVLGCSSSKPLTPEQQEALRQRRIARLETENAERLRGQDNSPAATRPFTRANWEKNYQTLRLIIDFLFRRPTLEEHVTAIKSDSPDDRREGMLAYADYPIGRNENAVKLYAEIAFGVNGAQSDNDYTVRAAAIRALNRARARQYVPQYLKTLADKNEHDWVRLEAAKALANMPDEKAVDVLTKVLANPEDNKDIRIAAADALRNFKNFSVAQALIGVLQDRDFGVSHQARKSLVLLTGHDFRYATRDWLKYLTNAPNPFA